MASFCCSIVDTGEWRYEAQQTSKDQTNMPQFMIESPRTRTIFCFALWCVLSPLRPEREQKHTTENFVGFLNYSPLLTMVVARVHYWLREGEWFSFCSDQDSSSVSGQALCCDWLPGRWRWVYLARSGLPAMYLIDPLLTKFVRSRWLNIGLALHFCVFIDLYSVSVHKHAKLNLANIQWS